MPVTTALLCHVRTFDAALYKFQSHISLIEQKEKPKRTLGLIFTNHSRIIPVEHVLSDQIRVNRSPLDVINGYKR